MVSAGMEGRRRPRVGATGLIVLFLTVVWSCEEADGCSFWKSRNSQQSSGQGSSPGTSVPSPTTVSSNTIYVDIAGTGNFASVQAAVNSIPQGNPQHTIIVVKPGTYVEKVTVPADLPYVTIQGAGMGATFITWQAIASDIGSDGQPLTAYNSASAIVLANNFVAKDISFKNTAPIPPAGVNGEQGAAFRISGDMAAFYNCGFYGAQDTLCDDIGRHYFKNCYVEGTIDFVFGNGQSLYMYSTFNSIAQNYGAVAAQDRQSPNDPSGFSFVNCKVTGSGSIFLGRAMGPYSRIIYSYSWFDNIIDPIGWDDWGGETSKDGTVIFGQFQCSGPGADETARVSWSHEFAQVDVQPFYELSFINGNQWLNEV